MSSSTTHVLPLSASIAEKLTVEPGVPAPMSGSWYAHEGEYTGGSQVMFALPATIGFEPRVLSFDMLTVGPHFLTCQARIEDGDRKVLWASGFSPLTHCQTRIVLRLGKIDWSKAKQLVLAINRKTQPRERFCFGSVQLRTDAPPRLEKPLAPNGPLTDAFGQSPHHGRKGAIRNTDELVTHLTRRRDAAVKASAPDDFNRWGGWKERRVEATGYFRTHHDGRRWWLVDPDGHLFWSAGLDCVHPLVDHEAVVVSPTMDLRSVIDLPETNGLLASAWRNNVYRGFAHRELNHLQMNFMRAFGAKWHEAWRDTALGDIRGWGFNTAGAWSDEAAACARGVPYCRVLDLNFRFPRTPLISGAFPDVFHPNLEQDARDIAEPLWHTSYDPAMLGYFMQNEPGASWTCPEREGPAVTMMQQTPHCASRKKLAEILKERYGTDAALAAAWGVPATFAAVADGPWTLPLNPGAMRDLADFSAVMASRLINVVAAACRRADPFHLNLGIRWWSFPPIWVLKAMQDPNVDVVSFNYYQPKPAMVTYGYTSPEPGAEEMVEKLHKPFIIGEWHFGAYDGGLPGAGLNAVPSQEDRGQAYRYYVENAAATPWCVGCHWFNLYDRSVLGGWGSNENQNIGFLDLCHRPHDAIVAAATQTHRRLYRLAAGLETPCSKPAPQIFPSR